MYSDKMINQINYEKLNSLNARYRIQRDLKYAVSEKSTIYNGYVYNFIFRLRHFQLGFCRNDRKS